MSEPPVFSSQGSEYDRYRILEDQENTGGLKPKKPPTVTPKRFKKFFTPRASLPTKGARQSRAGRQLRDITKNGANLRRAARPLPNPAFDETDPDRTRPLKRRRRSIDIASSPPQSSPLKHLQTADQIKVIEDQRSSPIFSDNEDFDEPEDDFQTFPRPIRRFPQTGRNRGILERSFGGYAASNRGRKGLEPCADWRSETTHFVSKPSDIHRFTGSALPFCTASCNTNSLVAIGEEEGGVRLIDSSCSSQFSTAHVSFRPHHNAIMDIAFSNDDYLLATASGDQTARIIDMHTQQTVCVLSGHKSSVKQVRFQPNDNDLLATSSRDGSVLLWDMRCGGKGSITSLRTAFARNVDNGDMEPAVRYSKYSLDAGIAHRTTKRNLPRTAPSDPHGDVTGVSITAIQHLSHGREHLLLTTSETNSSIKLWDLRNVGRRSSNALLSSTPVPESHGRNYGINAIALSGDGARLYTVCRDGVAYAYSTNHLVLGCVPEISSAADRKGRLSKRAVSGLGPLYGFKHPMLRMGTFYVKAAVRPARGDKSELLALGSSDDCAVLFPTDERYMPQRQLIEESEESDLPSLPARMTKAGIPIYENGTALIRGHDKEVTSLTWSHDGELVTISDDFTARCWREDGDRARQLRGCGEGEGLRWGCGWADADAAWDEDDD